MTRLHAFEGGIRLPLHADAALDHPILNMPLPDQLVYPMQTRRSAPRRALVGVGDSVSQGQIIAVSDTADVPLLASAAGVVESMGDKLVLRTQQSATEPLALEHCDTGDKFATLKRMGVQGLGGATFPSYQKLQSAELIDTLIINAAECEPQICCDQALIRESVDEVVAGIRLLLELSQARACLIGIEDSMEQDIALLRDKLAEQPDPRINLLVIPTIYPTGSERQLIRLLTGKSVSASQLPRDHGVLCFNIATACAVKSALLDQQPLLERIVTISGDAVSEPRNIRARFGTRLIDLLNWLLPEPIVSLSASQGSVIMGGPMSGIEVDIHHTSVSAATNCLLLDTNPASRLSAKQSLSCIRCGECDKVCPARLLPQQLHWFCRAGDLQNAEKFHLSDCLECGCCDYVCPSGIALTPQFRQARNDAAEAQRLATLSARSQQRHQARNERLQRKQQARQLKLQQRKQALEKKRAEKLRTAKSGEPD